MSTTSESLKLSPEPSYERGWIPWTSLDTEWLQKRAREQPQEGGEQRRVIGGRFGGEDGQATSGVWVSIVVLAPACGPPQSRRDQPRESDTEMPGRPVARSRCGVQETTGMRQTARGRLHCSHACTCRREPASQ